jgi:hypothetical protein
VTVRYGQRRFLAGGDAWDAWVAGRGAVGTGVCGPGLVEAIHFARAGDERPAFEALLASGRLAHLFDDELVALLAAATPIVERPVAADWTPPSRRLSSAADGSVRHRPAASDGGDVVSRRPSPAADGSAGRGMQE